jgi:hypothetical protein
VNRQRFNTDPDPFHFNADPDLDLERHQNDADLTPILTQVGK